MASRAYKIEKGVPLPDASSGKQKYPFVDMEPGDSVFIAGVDRSRLSSAAHNVGLKSNPKKTFAIRKEGLGLRVWRTA